AALLLHEVAGRGQLVVAARDLPHPGPQPLHLEVGERVGGVPLLGEETVGTYEHACEIGHDRIDCSVSFNIADLFEHVADAVPDRVAVVGASRHETYRELD